MLRTIRFPIKGTFYYAAELALESHLIQKNTLLYFKAEPDSAYDKNAIQIWLPTHFHSAENDPPPLLLSTKHTPTFTHGLLIGYVPRLLAPTICKQLKHASTLNPQVIHRGKKGKIIEIDYELSLQTGWIANIQVQLISFWIRQTTRLKKFFNLLTH